MTLRYRKGQIITFNCIVWPHGLFLGTAIQRFPRSQGVMVSFLVEEVVVSMATSSETMISGQIIAIPWAFSMTRNFQIFSVLK